jgi:trk system potassium uptake protein TrkA
MYVIIAGCRKVGSNLALELSQENHDVVVIDSDPSQFEALGSGFNGVTVTGMPIDEDVLRSAGVEQADALASVTDDDNMNIMVSQVAKELFHVPVVITRVYDPQREIIMKKMGLNTICPTKLAVQKIKSQLMEKDQTDTLNIYGTGVTFRVVKPARRLIGKATADIKDEVILGIIRNNTFTLLTPKTVVDHNDMLVVAEYASTGE